MTRNTDEEGKLTLSLARLVFVLVLMAIGLSVALIPNAFADEGHYIYPPDGLKTLSSVCNTTPRPDIPASAIPQFCQCWVARLQENVPWASLEQADLATNTNGIKNLSSAEDEILKMMVVDGEFCSRKVPK